MIQRVGILALGTLPLMLGCVAPDTDSPEDETDVAVEPLRKDHVGVNGLSSEDYQAFRSKLELATTEKLVTVISGNVTLTNLYVTLGLLSSSKGAKVFGYAAGCALRDGDVLTYGGQFYRGQGILSSTQGWPYAPLSAAARNDLLACMAAHVNPKGINVDILLSGETVLNDNVNHSAFDVEEALWVVKDDVDGVPHTHVWPLTPFAEICKVDPQKALDNRVCGQTPLTCDLIPHTDLNACSKDSTGAWSCLGVNALQTTLTTEGMKNLYAGSSFCPGL